LTGHANIGITRDTYSHLLPELQEDAAERFDRIIENDNSERNLGASVSKMLASHEDLATNIGEPPRNLTVNLLIKSLPLAMKNGYISFKMVKIGYQW